MFWNPAAGELDAAALADCDAVVNLAGESIAARSLDREAKSSAIRNSRVDGTRTIAAALAKPNGQPKILINASADRLSTATGATSCSTSPARRAAAIFCRTSAAIGKPPPNRPRRPASASC